MYITIEPGSAKTPLFRRTFYVEASGGRSFGYGGLAYRSEWVQPGINYPKGRGWAFSLSLDRGQWKFIAFGLLFTFSGPTPKKLTEAPFLSPTDTP